MKRYLVFGGVSKNRLGGMCDLIGKFDDEEKAIAECEGHVWYHVWDSEIDKIIWWEA